MAVPFHFMLPAVCSIPGFIDSKFLFLSIISKNFAIDGLPMSLSRSSYLSSVYLTLTGNMHERKGMLYDNQLSKY